MVEAENFKIVSYAQVTTIEGVKTALVTNGPVVMIFPYYNTSSQPWIKGSSDNQIGYHAMSVVGYNSLGFIMRNSWGRLWGQGGYTLLPFAHFPLISEVWTTIDGISKPLQPPLKPSCCSCILL